MTRFPARVTSLADQVLAARRELADRHPADPELASIIRDHQYAMKALIRAVGSLNAATAAIAAADRDAYRASSTVRNIRPSQTAVDMYDRTKETPGPTVTIPRIVAKYLLAFLADHDTGTQATADAAAYLSEALEQQ